MRLRPPMTTVPDPEPADRLPAELRRPSVPDDARAWAERALGQPVTGTVRLRGASSAAVHRLHLKDGSRVVLRRYVWPGFLDNEPEAPGREVDALRFAHAHGVPVPEVLAADPDGSAVGDGVPALLMSYITGQPLGAPDPARLAEVAASIHAISADGLGHDYFGWYDADMVTPPPQSRQPKLWQKAIQLRRDAMPSYRPTFIHRDFHPGNLLWSRRQLVAIVDWPNGCRGPIGCDLAHCRYNLRHLSGPEAGDAFIEAYTALTGEALDPYWVLTGILEHDHDHWTPQRLARVEPDLADAVRSISG